MIPDEAVYTATCNECDWRYYALREARAANWAESHTEDDGHHVTVSKLQGAAK